MSCCIVAVIAGYVIMTWPKKKAPEIPVVSVEKVGVEDVEIYGDYVGRIRAHQFVEVRARVEGFLEKWHLPKEHTSKRTDTLCY